MPAQTFAFLGATGDSAGFCLAAALKAGHDCVALARTQSNLLQSLETKGVPASAVTQHLTIVEGDIRNAQAVKTALQIKSRVVDAIVSGIGSYPVVQWSLLRPLVNRDETLCRDACAAVLQALSDLQPARKPLYITIGTTGVQAAGKPRDVPLLFVPMYHWLLASPHEDKRAMEAELVAHMRLKDSQRGIRAYVVVKPSLLMDGDGCGVDAVRAGSNEEPAVGYTIQRKDVGEWTFAKLLVQEPRPEWVNGGVSITY